MGGVATLANDRTTAAFEHYLRGNGPDLENHLNNVVTIVYGQGRSWETVSRVLIAMPGPPDQRVVIVDSSGQVAVDTLAVRGGTAISNPTLANGHPISVNGAIVGTLYVQSPIGGEGGLASSSGGPSSGLSPSDRAFLAQVNQSLALAAVAAILVASILGVLLARQIIRPLRQLTRVAQRIAHGHLDERISITGHDEVAQLGDAFNGMAESLQRTENAR